MRYIINKVCNLILNKEPSDDGQIMIRVDGFEDLKIYEEIARKMTQSIEAQNMSVNIKLAKNKWNYFKDTCDDTTIIQSMKQHDWVADVESITHYRNLHKEDYLILLGTDEEEDQGGLMNCYAINPEYLVRSIKGKYSEVFESETEYFTEDDKKAIDKLYKDLFEYVPVDICRLSNIADRWKGKIVNVDDFITLFYEGLPEWGFPVRRLGLPSKSNIVGKKKNLLKDEHGFIQRIMFKKVSGTQYKKYLKKLEVYDTDEAIEPKYRSNHECWDEQPIKEYSSFSDVLKEYIEGKNIEGNKALLMNFDYAIVEDVLGIGYSKDSPPPRKSVTKLHGTPITVFMQALLFTLKQINNDNLDVEYVTFNFQQASIICDPSGIDEDGNQELVNTWRKVCVHCGGIIEYINQKSFSANSETVDVRCFPEDFFKPTKGNNMIDDGFVKIASASNKVNKIDFTVDIKISGKTIKSLYQWVFSDYSEWYHNFDDICAQDFAKNKDYANIPVGKIPKIKGLLFSKSEEEFFDKLDECTINYDFNLCDYISSKLPAQETKLRAEFTKLGYAFSELINDILSDGFYSLIGKTDSSLANVINVYTDLGKTLASISYPENIKWILDTYILAFTIVEKTKIFESEEEIGYCIVPSWHPAALEKMNDQIVFFLDGCDEWWNEALETGKDTDKEIKERLNQLNQMCMIQSSVDLFPSYGQQYFGCMASYGSYGLYGRTDLKNDNRLRDMIHKDAIYDDDFDTNEIKNFNDNARLIYEVLVKYEKAFPNSANNLSLAFIDPSELQPIIAALHRYIRRRQDAKPGCKIDMSLKILVKPENKGGRNYLAYWMDEIFSKEEDINIHTYLNEWHNKNELDNLLNGNNDIAFAMELLQVNSLGFINTNEGKTLPLNQCKFPIVFKPTPVSSTSVKRKIELSQPQFGAAYAHTQIVRYRNNIEEIPEKKYLAYKEAVINNEGKDIVKLLHEKAYWVVCVDSGMDGALLRNGNDGDDYSVIGFSTGKGAYGQYNLTVTTRNSILKTIEKNLKKRLQHLFKWSPEQTAKAAKLCVTEAGGLDGISLLSAVNTKDQNIHEFMAYILTSLREEKMNSDSALKIVIHLDSYKHWFNNEDDKDDSKSRPDFLVLEAVLNEANNLKLKATVTECKIAIESNATGHKNKAVEQVEHGIRVLSRKFDPNSSSINCRYWYAQLYRALAFAQITFSNDTDEYSILSSKLRNILDGEFEIEWNGKVLGYWIDMAGDEETIDTNYNGATVYNIPQKVIQSLLLDEDESQVNYVYIEPDTFVEDDEQERRIRERAEELKAEIEAIERNGRKAKKHKRDEIKPVKPVPENEDKPVVILISEESYKKPEPMVAEGKSNYNCEPGKNIEPEEENTHETENTESKTAEAKKTTALEDIRILVGRDKGNNNVFWEFGNKQLANRHLLITGTSGQGKTYAIQTMLYELAKDNVSSVVFDYTEGFRLDQLEPEFNDYMSDKINEHIVKFQGVPINPFRIHEVEYGGRKYPEKTSDVASRFANILTHVYGFGEQQQAAVYDATRKGLEEYGSAMNMDIFMKELDIVQSSNNAAKTVRSKMTMFYHGVDFENDTDFDWNDVLYSDEAKMNIFQLTMMDRETQIIVTELLLWDAWYYTKTCGNKNKPFVVVLDEAQNLSHKENSPSKAILTEGRKFGWSAWFATQSLRVLADDEVVRLMQAANRLYFKPTDEEIIKMAKQLDPSDSSKWIGPLKGLHKGECIFVGDRLGMDGKLGPTKNTVTRVTAFGERGKNE